MVCAFFKWRRGVGNGGKALLKILFLIHDLHHGGAEKVLVNLVNHMDHKKFDITILALFGGGVNEQFLSPEVRLLHGHSHAIPGNSHIMKLFSPQQLFRHYIKEKYDIIVSYLEGPSARIVSGCPNDGTRLVSWIHCTIKSPNEAAIGFRSFQEAQRSYQRFDCSVFVSSGVRDAFCRLIFPQRSFILHNVIDSDIIVKASQKAISGCTFSGSKYKLVGVGKLEEVKGFERLLRIHKRLLLEDHLSVHTYLLGEGSKREMMESWVQDNELCNSITFLGYQTNPYKYIAACDLFVCASFTEGFSTAATEALIVGTPVITTEVSGMQEMLGDNEYGVITENDEEALYRGIRDMLTTPGKLKYYKEKAKERGTSFNTSQTVRAVENMLESIIEKEL